MKRSRFTESQIVGPFGTRRGLSVQRACRAVNPSRAAYYRAAKDFAARDEPVIEALDRIVAKHGRWGFWKCYERLRLDGHAEDKTRNGI